MNRLKELLSRLWKFNDFDLIDVPNNYYVVRFKDDESCASKYKRVLFEGPWVIAQHCVLVQRRSPYFDPFHNPLGRIATWICIPNILLHCYTRKIIWRLGDMVGKTLKVDMNTFGQSNEARMKVERGRFARICVEIDLKKKLIPRVICALALFNVEYEGLGLICFACGRYGHRKEACPWKVSSNAEEGDSKMEEVHQAPPSMSPEKSLPASSDAFGPWMFVKKPVRAWSPRPNMDRTKAGVWSGRKMAQSYDEVKSNSSRFAAIADLNGQEEENEKTGDVTDRSTGSVEGGRKEVSWHGGNNGTGMAELKMKGSKNKVNIREGKKKGYKVALGKENV